MSERHRRLSTARDISIWTVQKRLRLMTLRCPPPKVWRPRKYLCAPKCADNKIARFLVWLYLEAAHQ